MFSNIKNWWDKQTGYKLNEIEQSLVTIIQSILEDPTTEIYTLGDKPYILKYKNGICRVSERCIKLFCDGKLVLHDITPSMAYKVRQMVRDRVDGDLTKIEDELDSKIVNFIKEL